MAVWGTDAHILDAMRHIGGDIVTFDVQPLERPAGCPPAAAWWFLISLRFASGCAGHIEILPTTGVVEERYELFGGAFRACATTTGGRGPSMRKSNLSPRVLKVKGSEKERRSGYGCHCRGRRA
jgi:hypothetical protein